MKWKWLVLGVLLGLSGMLLGASLLSRPYVYRGSLIDSSQPAPDFKLVDQNGEPFQLSAQQGQVVLVFFGYTYCPDVCPTTLADFKRVRAGLGEQADQVRLVFVTVDPERDTPERIRSYLNVFDPAISGLSGTPQELQPVWRDYGVFVQKQPGATPEGYLVDHSARVYAIDRAGRLRLTYLFGTPVEDLLADVQHLLAEG